MYSVIDNVIRLELFRLESNGTLQSINDILIMMHYAEKAEESQLSQNDHDIRKRSRYREELPKTSSIRSALLVPSLPQTGREPETGALFLSDKQELKGPNSPLEASFYGVSKKTLVNSSVNIDQDSVNSVVLEPDYSTKNRRMLVAAELHLSSQSKL